MLKNNKKNYKVDNAFCDTVDRVVEISEKKHITVILGILLLEGPKYFGELRREIKCISAKTLAARLKLLEFHKIIFRKIEAHGKVRKVLYELTQKGVAFYKVMKTMKEWGDIIFETK